MCSTCSSQTQQVLATVCICVLHGSHKHSRYSLSSLCNWDVLFLQDKNRLSHCCSLDKLRKDQAAHSYKGGASYIFVFCTVSCLLPYVPNFFFYGATAPSGPGPPHCQGFMITLRHTTVCRTPLDEWPARRRALYMTTHNTITKNKHAWPLRDSNSQFQQARGRRPTP